MSEESRPQGKTTVASDVLVSIAKLSALSVPGVYQMANAPAEMSRLFKSAKNDGVHVSVDGNLVSADLYIIMNSDAKVHEVSKNIQTHVSRAISEMVGLEVGTINIHIEDIHFN